MPTLYEILKNKFSGSKPPKADDKYNPIGARKGNSVTLDSLDFRGLTFFVQELQEYSVGVDDKTFQFMDYVLQANPLEGDSVTVRLRVVPAEKGSFGIPYRAMVLSLYDDLAYNEGLHNVVRDNTKKFVVDDSEKGLHEEYWRVNDVGTSYSANVAISDGKDNYSKKLEFWDYSRMTKLDGVDVEQFLFVEMNKDKGWFQLWRGTELNPEQVVVM